MKNLLDLSMERAACASYLYKKHAQNRQRKVFCKVKRNKHRWLKLGHALQYRLNPKVLLTGSLESVILYFTSKCEKMEVTK
jgi:hypothetical protein